MKAMEIKEITVNELEDVCGFIKEVFVDALTSSEAKIHLMEHFTYETLKNKIRSKNEVIFAAFEGREIIGFINGNNNLNVLTVDYIFVRSDKRRSGVGSQLIAMMEDRARKFGYTKIWQQSLSLSSDIFSVNTKLGYTVCVSLKKHWYGQDCYMWEKKL